MCNLRVALYFCSCVGRVGFAAGAGCAVAGDTNLVTAQGNLRSRSDETMELCLTNFGQKNNFRAYK